MTAPGSLAPAPGRWSARADLRPVVVLWSLLLAGLLTALPCAGSAKAVTAGRTAAHAVPPTTGTAASAAGSPTASAAAPVAVLATGGPGHAFHHGIAVGTVDRDGLPLIWCAADGEHPLPGSGCSSHSFCGPEAQLPNAPPQPAAVALPRLVVAEALPGGTPFGVLAGPDHAPDLHELQVHRS